MSDDQLFVGQFRPYFSSMIKGQNLIWLLRSNLQHITFFSIIFLWHQSDPFLQSSFKTQRGAAHAASWACCELWIWGWAWTPSPKQVTTKEFPLPESHLFPVPCLPQLERQRDIIPEEVLSWEIILEEVLPWEVLPWEVLSGEVPPQLERHWGTLSP